MVIISRTRTERLPLDSIRWRIVLAFLLVIGFSFAVMYLLLTGYVSNYLYQQRIRQDSLSAERLATTVAPLFQSAASDSLNDTLISAGGELGGRFLVIDPDGKVQFDSFSRALGTRLQLPEVLDVLTGGEAGSYGIHLSGSGGVSGEEPVAVYASRLVGPRGSLGVLLYVAQVGEMVESLNAVIFRLTMVFALVALVAVIAALVFSGVLTRPVNTLTQATRRMGKGDLTVRVPEKGSGELKNLARSYNWMAEQLETLDQSRSQFVSNASHELRTPLASMKVLLENVLYQPDMPAEIRTEFLTDVDGEIDRLANIVSDLLLLSRMDNQKLELHPVTMSLTATCEETIRLLTPVAEKKHQTVTGRIQQGVTITGDPDRLKQVVYNLTENAIKYTPEGGVITVTLARRGRTAVVTVRDNGIGIPKADLPRIFDRFYRVDKARSRESGGTGLGLSIVRQMVQLSGGQVTVESEEGQGSVFTVTLPVDGKEKRVS
ncbi:MAG: HAMP domain-containing protein [Clostridia bacterium]|nr:HAMP domain-containing protein [Clostridia bacterium]